MRIAESCQNAPNRRNRLEGIDLADETHDEQHRQQQQHQWQHEQPQEKQGNPETEAPAARPAPHADNTNQGNHGSDSSSRMASWAVISPRRRRSKISVREGDGFVSTNSRLSAMRVRRALTVG